MKIAINGFGRIGRHVLRAIEESGRSDLEIVAINDLASSENSAHLLKYDSTHGPAPFEISLDGDKLTAGGTTATLTSVADPKQLPWAQMGVDLVMECTGRFVSHDGAAQHLEAGAKKVLISAPGKNVEKTVVYGVNHNIITADDVIVSNASCTTNCLAPVAKVLQDNFGIESGYMTTIHAYTADQRLQDADHKDLRRARSAAMSIIPTSTGAARAVGLVLPELAGKLDGAAMRVPVSDGSLVDLKVNLAKDVSVEAINQAMVEASVGALEGVLAVSNEPLVSADYIHNPASSTVDLLSTQTIGPRFARIVSWYDNEWGFANRMLDTATAMLKA